jgi:16S rRNA A1518/A1519 N6-dimethyltransferase RsmA/KsgA/DIM1 with predicted DNA glycosylase/AP lyase activity
VQTPAENRNILDLGCGKGEDTSFFLEQGCLVTAVDIAPIDEEYLKYFPARENLTVLRQKMADFSFTPENFDVVNARSSLPFTSPPRSV